MWDGQNGLRESNRAIFTHLVLNKRYVSAHQTHLSFATLTANAKRDYIPPLFKRLPLVVRDSFVLSNTLCQFINAKKWVLLRVYLLICTFIYRLAA